MPNANTSKSLSDESDDTTSAYLSKNSPHPLRICCYGSSSSSTPVPYLSEAESLGMALARRGHTCVNGAGSSGCMAAMNDGASAHDGHIVGVIHEMFVVDGSDWVTDEGGAHKAFRHGHREIVVAGGNDLQERKRLLVEGADGLIVLPGGPGTWDELWEMCCARNLGFTNIPICCVNVDGYYEPFWSMLDRAYEDKLIRNTPEDILHFESTSVDAVRWIESFVSQRKEIDQKEKEKLEKKAAYRRMDSALTVDRPSGRRKSVLSSLRGSFLSSPPPPTSTVKKWKGGVLVEDHNDAIEGESGWFSSCKFGQLTAVFVAGSIVGATAATAATFGNRSFRK